MCDVSVFFLLNLSIDNVEIKFDSSWPILLLQVRTWKHSEIKKHWNKFSFSLILCYIYKEFPQKTGGIVLFIKKKRDQIFYKELNYYLTESLRNNLCGKYLKRSKVLLFLNCIIGWNFLASFKDVGIFCCCLTFGHGVCDSHHLDWNPRNHPKLLSQKSGYIGIPNGLIARDFWNLNQSVKKKKIKLVIRKV